MNVGSIIRGLVPQSLKQFVRQRKTPWRVSGLISPYLPTSVCVDVGASYYPHTKWLTFLNSPKTCWLAVEPNEANLGYIKTWKWPCKISACTTGLSRDGGKKTLYVTNVDSGSSLLPPEISPSMQHRVTNLDYFFPVKEKHIETLTLLQAVEGQPDTAPIFVKLDTQGTELSILQGAKELFDVHRFVGIEMESTLLAQPVMRGSGKFWEACEYLESQGFELLYIHPIAAIPRSGLAKSKSQLRTYLNECDAVFALRQDIAAELKVEYRVSLLAFYLTYFFYEEATSVLERDSGVVEYLKSCSCNVKELLMLLRTTTQK